MAEQEASAREFYRALSSFTFRIAGDDTEYVFIQWVPDEGGYEIFCQERYEITTKNAPHPILEFNDSSCDI